MKKKERRTKKGGAPGEAVQIDRNEESPELLAAIDAGVRSLGAKGARVTTRVEIEAVVRSAARAKMKGDFPRFPVPRGTKNPPLVTSEMVREILEPSALTLQAAELVMPLLRPKEITYQDLWTMLEGLWALRRELHPKSKEEFSRGFKRAKQRRATKEETLEIMSNEAAMNAIAEYKAGRTKFGDIDDIPAGGVAQKRSAKVIRTHEQ